MIDKKHIKQVVFFLLNRFRQKSYINKIVSNHHLIILNLHRVSNEVNPFYPSLTPKLFEELLKFITKEFNVITFKEIEKYKDSKKPNLILSFDDGFYDFLEYAMPILEKYNVRANLNVIPQCIESGKPVWDVMLGDFLDQAPVEWVNQIELPDFEMKLNESNKSQYGLALTHYLKQRSKEERKKLWVSIDKGIQELDITLTKMLNKDEIIQISKIHEIGAHSYSHESMGIESKEYFETDFFKCEEYFKNKIKLPLDIYAFPSGSYQDYQLDFLEKNGINHILLVGEKYSDHCTNRHFRFTYYADSTSEVKLRALGFHR
jgi:peptidoglycan/xylan/chitin deacetylase (PgdA/CDA1 family)